MKFPLLSIVMSLAIPAIASEITPAKRLITDEKGRTMDGVIVAKTTDTITFKRQNDGRRFEIKIATLSANDQEFIRGLESSEPALGKTIIEPGKRVILALPFEKQDRGGICAAASTLNILKFLDPKIQLSQTELFALFNSGRSGASPTEVIQGIRALGFTGKLIRIDDAERKPLIADVKANLDAGRPMLVASRSHAMVLIGYDNEGKEPGLYVWNQKMPDKKPIDGLPKGTEKMSESEFLARLVHIMFIEPTLPLPASPPSKELAKEPSVQRHHDKASLHR